MIIGAAPIASKKVFEEFDPKDHYVICADGGYDTAVRYGIRPDLIVGDFDSSKIKPPRDIRALKLPVQKDETDTMAAVMIGFKFGYNSFTLVGCLGGERFDHSVANIHVLMYIANRGGNAVLCEDNTKIFVLRGGRIVLTELMGATVSVFPVDGSSCNLTYEGLEYPLYQQSLTAGSPLMGVSNRIVSNRAEIRVNIGSAMIVLYTPEK